MKRLYPVLLALCLLLAVPLTALGADSRRVAVTVDGVPLDAAAYISEDGATMVPLRALAEALGFTVKWDQDSRTAAVISRDGEAPGGTETPGRAPLVVLDPGHGGTAPGAIYGGIEEKDLNLAIASQAAALLEEAGVRVLMTRTGDWDVGLYDRTALANGQGADLFVSVHCNASLTNPEAAGIYTAAASADSPGWALAETLRRAMMETSGAGDMGTEARPGLAVLRTAEMPAALVECGYMSTPGELALLVRPDYQAGLARGIAAGVLAYLAPDA